MYDLNSFIRHDGNTANDAHPENQGWLRRTISWGMATLGFVSAGMEASNALNGLPHSLTQIGNGVELGVAATIAAISNTGFVVSPLQSIRRPSERLAGWAVKAGSAGAALSTLINLAPEIAHAVTGDQVDHASVLRGITAASLSYNLWKIGNSMQYDPLR